MASDEDKKDSSHREPDFVRYHLVPPLFVVFFPIACQFLVVLPRDDGTPIQLSHLMGNAFVWKCLLVLAIWSLFFLWIPSKKCYGSTTTYGETPEYVDNGMLFYLSSTFGFCALCYWYPQIATEIYDNMPSMIGALNVTALMACAGLLLQAKYAQQSSEIIPDFPILYDFYRGRELHPKILGVRVKQLACSRMGMITWQILPLAYLFTAIQRDGGQINYGFLVSVALQSIYIAKFYWWESGYFCTLDMILDRVGFYLVWGCLVYIPSFYCFSSYYFVTHPPSISPQTAAIIFLVGLIVIYFNYDVDYQKELFCKTNGDCQIWGQQPTFIRTEYHTTEGLRRSKLLTSGWWGIAWHINYTFELLLALAWNAPGYGLGIWPFMYNIFLFFLLVHRVFRDEEKCSKKYGRSWAKYREQVPYNLIPYVW
ncbi:unnamed protein product [Cyprideis torosa]|uniref:7-dehydrocholesterol reductase n=1 Tax=Cyprideis torosa TaxID=163714 RepID=A0A7R8WGJ8_9CRUS|nr:unnamed protein product [Cyprideis torosa]CAG0893075.1 unnamed protein product [Cyprideis torosa]